VLDRLRHGLSAGMRLRSLRPFLRAPTSPAAPWKESWWVTAWRGCRLGWSAPAWF